VVLFESFKPECEIYLSYLWPNNKNYICGEIPKDANSTFQLQYRSRIKGMSFFFFLRNMAGRYLPSFGETVSFFFSAQGKKKKQRKKNKEKKNKEKKRRKKTKKKKRMEESKVIEKKGQLKAIILIPKLLIPKTFCLFLKNKYSHKENNLCVETKYSV
jgi:hypothetical protein